MTQKDTNSIVDGLKNYNTIGNGGKYTNPNLVDTRIDEIVNLIIGGLFRLEDLRAYSNKQGWNLGDRQLQNYLKRACARFSEYNKVVHEEEAGKALARYQHLYFKCLRIQDYKTALQINKAMCEMLGLNAPTKIAATDVKGEDIIREITVKVIK